MENSSGNAKFSKLLDFDFDVIFLYIFQRPSFESSGKLQYVKVITSKE